VPSPSVWRGFPLCAATRHCVQQGAVR
jgi:hypothetical protein